MVLQGADKPVKRAPSQLTASAVAISRKSPNSETFMGSDKGNVATMGISYFKQICTL